MKIDKEKAKAIGDTLGIPNDDASLTGKIAWAHLKEFPDYYSRLAKMEKDADAFWKDKHKA